MPAVLRPNEFPAGAHVAKPSPTGEDVDDDERAVRSSGSFTSLSGILSLSRLSRRSTGDSGKVVDWNWDLAHYAPVNGEPTRRHWKVRVCESLLFLIVVFILFFSVWSFSTTQCDIATRAQAYEREHKHKPQISMSTGSRHGTTMSRSQ